MGPELWAEIKRLYGVDKLSFSEIGLAMLDYLRLPVSLESYPMKNS